MLHRLILSQCSGFFEASTSEEWSRAQARVQGSGPGYGLGSIGEDSDSGSLIGRPGPQGGQGEKYRWRYELDWGSKDDEVPMLVQRVSSIHHLCDSD